MSAEAVHSAAQSRLPEISLATVYNTLNELVQMGELKEFSAGPGPKLYDPNVEFKHHHLACTNCGTIRDVSLEPPADFRPRDAQGFTLTHVDIIFYGLCESCSRSEATEQKTALPA